MIWVALFSGASALGLVFFNVQPVWLQYLVFGISLSFFVTYLLKDVGSKKVENNFFSWMQKRRSILAVFFLLAVSSFLARRYEQVFDLSRYKEYSLRDQTISWLQKITEPVQVLIFLKNDDKTFGYAEWIQEQANQYTPNIKVELKNINREILLTQKYGVKHAGETVLVSQKNWVKVGSFGEKDLVTGLIRVLAKTSSSVCFLVGHGEPDIMDELTQGLGSINTLLKSLGYTLKIISLDAMESSGIEKECGALMIISPQKEFLPVEAERLATIMRNEKLPLFFALDSTVSQVVREQLKNEGLSLSSNLVVNTDNTKEGIPLTDIILYPGSILSPMLLGVTEKIYLSLVQLVSFSSEVTSESLVWHSLIATPPDGRFRLLGGKEQSEMLPLAAYALDKNGKIKRLVFGSGQPFLPRSFGFGNNQQLFLGSLRWLLGEEQMAWVDSREKDEIYMKISEEEEFWLKNVFLYGLPGTAFLVLFFFWFKRRVGT